ncbi:7TM-DISM domain-containing protein [Pseudoduganella namucuonensis]|uniref:histidine kinase n=1 Tax=Pseudoduganella namucuonensis TaxID=1035707 RepID=A0A1I7KHE2_9BURK|nr:7TM-DISM domain-containing protein [Pseudoduganella namucuonensis]SFU96850.1 Signal transduction histidine kinase [Pseudoduganella namucuonensis]
MNSPASMQTLLRSLCLLLALLALPNAMAARAVMRFADNLPLRLEGRLEYLEDVAGALTLERARALPPERYTPLLDSNFSKGFSASTYWVRFTLRNPGPDPVDWVLQHRLPFTDHVRVWVVSGGRVRLDERAGDRTLAARRQLPSHLPSFRYLSAPGESAEVYVRLANEHAAETQLVFRLDTLQSFIAHAERDENRLGILYGVPLALAFSSLVGAAVARDRRFSTYALYALATVAVWMGFNGHFERYLMFDAPDLFNNLLHVVMLAQTIFLLLFAREFLQTRGRMPRFDRLFRAMILAACAGIALRLCGVFTLVTQLTLALMALSSVTTLAAWRAWRMGMEHARWFFFAQLCSTVPVAVGLAGVRLGLYAYDGFVNFQGIYFAELLLLAVAQHDHVRRTQDRQRKLEREHERALAERNAFLEAEMAARSAALAAMERRVAFVAEVGAVTQRVAGGEFSARLPMPDETALRPLATSVNAMAESLARLEGARRHWIAEISHELRTPLAGLICEIEAMLDGVRPLGLAQVESLHGTAQRLTRLVDDLHELAMSDLRPLGCKFAPVDYRQLMTDLMPHFGAEAAKRGLTLALECEPGPAPAMWDGGRVNQLLINLIANSIAYTDAPGAIRVRATALPERVRIEVEDSAPGLGRDELARVFEPLYRAQGARRRRADGSGLGLKICRAIVDAHHGTIGVSASALGGVLVRVELPLAPAGAAEPA